jgi:hypothetical protein
VIISIQILQKVINSKVFTLPGYQLVVVLWHHFIYLVRCVEIILLETGLGMVLFRLIVGAIQQVIMWLGMKS